MVPKCRSDLDILLLKLFKANAHPCLQATSVPLRPVQTPPPAPSVLPYRGDLLPPLLSSLLLSVKKQFNLKVSTSLVLFPFPSAWVRGAGGTGIYTHTCLHVMSLHTTETSFCNYVLCLLLLLGIWASNMLRRQLGNLGWYSLPKIFGNIFLKKTIMLASISFTDLPLPWNASNPLLQLSWKTFWFTRVSLVHLFVFVFGN